MAALLVWYFVYEYKQPVANAQTEKDDKKTEIIPAITPAPTPQKIIQTETIMFEIGACSQPHVVAISMTSLEKSQTMTIDINVSGQHTPVSLEPGEKRIVEAPFNANFDGEIKLPMEIFANDKQVYDDTITLYCEPSGGKEDLKTKSGIISTPTTTTPPIKPSPGPTTTPSTTETPVTTPTTKQTPIATIVKPPDTQIPEFPTILLPIAAILGLLFLFERRKK